MFLREEKNMKKTESQAADTLQGLGCRGGWRSQRRGRGAGALRGGRQVSWSLLPCGRSGVHGKWSLDFLDLFL